MRSGPQDPQPDPEPSDQAAAARGSREIVRVARDLNRAGLWTIYRKSRTGWKPSEKVRSLTLARVTWSVSAAGIERIRTPKGERTSSGAAGLGKRTVCAYAVGELGECPTTAPAPTFDIHTVHFNPFKHEAFMLGWDGVATAADLEPAPAGLTLRFIEAGRVEVVA